MIKYTATRPDKEVNTAAQRPRLIIDIHATIDCERIELIRVMLELLQFVLHLFDNNKEVDEKFFSHDVMSRSVLMRINTRRSPCGPHYFFWTEICCLIRLIDLPELRALWLGRE